MFGLSSHKNKRNNLRKQIYKLTSRQDSSEISNLYHTNSRKYTLRKSKLVWRAVYILISQYNDYGEPFYLFKID